MEKGTSWYGSRLDVTFDVVTGDAGVVDDGTLPVEADPVSVRLLEGVP